MPDEEALSEMYGTDYQQFLSAEHYHSGEIGLRDVTRYLKDRHKGVFLDYACGAGRLLGEVSKLGWDAVGYEYDSNLAKRYSEKCGLKIVASMSELGEGFLADVVHLGDVLEHLTDINEQFPAILDLLRKGGLLIAQGPLEANRNLFFRAIELNRKWKGRQVSRTPPYHVSLASTLGQRRLFQRFGLEEMEFRVYETAHPAPERISAADFRRPRSIALFLLRKLSQATSRISDAKVGNRYFFAGRKV
jgi:SAM-dependent methyltransferase